MATDSYPGWTDRVRKDPLGPVGYNRLYDNFRWVEALLGREHHTADYSAASLAGGHNAQEIPREVGSVELVGGPAYTNHNFRFATGNTRPALGSCSLTLDPLPYTDGAGTGLPQMTVQHQNCSETGINKPCFTTAQISSTSAIVFYHWYLTSVLGAGNAWAAEDAGFCVAVHGAPVNRGALAGLGGQKISGDFFTDYNTDYNLYVEEDAKLRAKFLLEHDSSGNHTTREVAKSWAHIYVDAGGGVFRVRDTGTRNALTVSRPGVGIARLTNSSAWTLDAQPFVMTDYQRSNSGAETDIYCAVTPRSLITTTTIDVYLYKFDTAALTWARADTDFYIAVHAG